MASQVAVLSAAMAPAWDAFFAERVFWPFVALLLCSLLVRALKPIYTSARRNSRSFRYFLFVYVGTPDRESVPSPYLVAVVLGLRAVLSAVVTTISIWRTYTLNTGDEEALSAVIRILFAGSYMFMRLQEGFDWTKVWSLTAIVDVLSITPHIMPRKFDLSLVPEETRWLTLEFMRIVTALDSFLALRKLFRNEAASQTLLSRAIVSCLRILVLCICMGGAIFVLEVLGEIPGFEDRFVQTGMGDLSFQMCYWIVTTISTVGYGDFSPTTIPARTAIVFFIFGGVIFFGAETASFVELLDDTSKGLGSYHNTSRAARHILVTGNGCHKFSSLMESFLLETLTGDLDENQIPDVVFLSEHEFDTDLRDFVDLELPTSLASKVFFLRGSVMNDRDLERAMVETAVICLVLPDVDTNSPATEDSVSVMMALTMSRHFPGLRLRIMLLEPEGAKNAALLSIAFPRCFSAHEMKSAIFAKNTHIVGLVTFLSGLMQSRVDHYSTDQLEKLSRADAKRHWRLEYAQSMKRSLIGFVISPYLANMTFPAVARKVYEDSRGGVLLIAVAQDGQLILNYDDVIQVDQVVVAIASKEKHCMPFAECHGNLLKEWRFQFLHARSQRLKTDLHKAEHPGKTGEALLLHQPGMDRRWFLSKTAGRPKRTAAEGVSSFQVDAMVRQVSQDSDVKVGRLKGMMGHEASRAAPDLDVLKGHPRLTVLVVFHEESQPIWEQVVCFLHYFHQQSKILDKAIIVLSGVHPPSSILEEWEDQSCCFLVGKLTNTKNLMHAGVEAARNVIIMGRKRPEESVKLRTTALADAECVTLAGYIEQALAQQNAITGWRASQSVLYEFGYTDSVFLTGHLFEVAQRPAAMRLAKRLGKPLVVENSEAPTLASSRRSGLGSNKQGTRLDRLNRDLDKGSFALNESFAAGQAFTLDFFGGLLGHIYKFPASIEFLQMVLMPDRTDQRSELWQVPCPTEWVGRTFGSLVLELLTESSSDRKAFGNWSGCAVPVALYRQSRDRFLTPSSSGFTSTLPDFDSQLEASDLITVVAPKSFIEAQPRVTRSNWVDSTTFASEASLSSETQEDLGVISVREADVTKAIVEADPAGGSIAV